MKALKILSIAAVVIVGLFVIVGLMLPRGVHVERSTMIEAPKQQVFALVSGFARFNEWSPWADLDPEATYVLSGPEQGLGARMEWRSDKPEVGAGAQEVIAIQPGREVRVKLSFEGQGEANATMLLAGGPESTRATWSFDMDLGMNPVMRWMGLMIDGPIGADYEKGLSRLKSLAEGEAAAAREAAAEGGALEAATPDEAA